MGSGFHGGFKPYKSKIDENAEAMQKDYPCNSNGYFGEKGKNVRIIKTPTPEATSVDFYMRLGRGGFLEPLANGHGTRTMLSDGTIIVHRMVTSTKGSPAVSITVIFPSKVKSQKIHFIREE